MKSQIEIACFNINSALIAANAGADRVEFCANFELGGTTPNLEETAVLISKTKTPVYVMIRPRGGDFHYSEEEINTMKNSIQDFKKLNVNGFVFGILNSDNTVDVQKNKELVTLCQPFPCTFHRAFDEVPNTKNALEDVIDCGFKTILTSGTQPNVVAGKTMLKNLIAQAQNRIVIMPGGGLRSSNLNDLHTDLQSSFYHSSALIDGTLTADIEEVKKLKSILNE